MGEFLSPHQSIAAWLLPFHLKEELALFYRKMTSFKSRISTFLIIEEKINMFLNEWTSLRLVSLFKSVKYSEKQGSVQSERFTLRNKEPQRFTVPMSPSPLKLFCWEASRSCSCGPFRKEWFLENVDVESTVDCSLKNFFAASRSLTLSPSSFLIL